MRYFYISIALLFTCIIPSCKQNTDSSTNEENETYNSIDTRVEVILSEMTLKEKIGQMTQFTITTFLQDSILEDYGNVTTFIVDTTKLTKLIRDWHIGSFLNGRAVSPENWVHVTSAVQRINAQYSSIPIIYGIDHMHGASYLKNGTIFPHNINIGCTFDTIYAYDASNTAVYETADLGHNWVFSPVLGIGKAKIWGRYYETFGEDPHLCGTMGVAAIHGIQDSSTTAPYKVAACAKHFIGYSDPKSGWDRTPAEIPTQALREFFLPPFKKAVDAGVKTIMINSGEVNGIPVHASYEILTTLLREELGFEGIAVTDWKDIKALSEMHFVAPTEKEATLMAINAGVDMSMVPEDTSFCVYLKELVDEGKITEERINQSVRRILKVKMELGLFEKVMPRTDRLNRINTEKSITKALNAARESIVLIKNDQHVLPLKNKKILLTGFTHDNKRALCGGWTYRFAADGDHWFPKEMLTIKDAIKQEFGEENIQTASDITELKAMSSSSDVIVIATGESEAYAETQGTIDDLTLDKHQITLIQEAVKTQKPVILILTEGRPRLIADVADDVDGILFAGLPGVYGAQAIAEILSGKVNPSGKMSFTYPKKSGHIIAYNHKRAEYSSMREVSDELKKHAIAPFGYGLSYASFTYTNLQMDTIITDKDQLLSVSVDVKNTSKTDGKEAVLWFISDEYASITRPVKELVHFDKKLIPAEESRTFTLTINPKEMLSFPDKNGNQLLEDGSFELRVGDISRRFWLKTN